MSSYSVSSHAVPVSAGMMIAVPLELVASPLKNGRDLGGADRSALVIGGTEKIRAGGAVVFVKVVAVAEARVKRDGQVRAKGSPVHHATLGPLEDKAGPGVAGGIAGRARRWPGTWRWCRGRGRGGRRRRGRPGTGGTRSARSPWKNCGTWSWARPGGSTRTEDALVR